MTEFELIRTYFTSATGSRADVRVGIGDDTAFLLPPAGMQMAVTTDLLVAGVHFFEDVDPATLGHKSLAVNLSDLAAVGAEPAWFLLSLAIPKVDERWLEHFSRGMFSLAQRYNIQLVGGDTSRGPLTIGITAMGHVPAGKGLLRSGARVGDAVYVTGTLGDAALSLAQQRKELCLESANESAIRTRLESPTPRVSEGLVLRDIASSAIDISDGLLADLSHILRASGVGARVSLGTVPLSSSYRTEVARLGWDYALSGGDDYELCFTVPPERIDRLNEAAAVGGFVWTRIGEITAGGTLDVYNDAGQLYRPRRDGHDHFR